jgi:hypothetical protein
MKAIDLVGRVFRALAGHRARRQHRPHAGPATVAVSLGLWQRADRAGAYLLAGPHALVRRLRAERARQSPWRGPNAGGVTRGSRPRTRHRSDAREDAAR